MNREQRRNPDPLLTEIHPGATGRLGLGRSTIYKLIEAGEIETVTIGRRRLVVTESLDAYVAKLRGGAA